MLQLMHIGLAALWRQTALGSLYSYNVPKDRGRTTHNNGCNKLLDGNYDITANNIVLILFVLYFPFSYSECSSRPTDFRLCYPLLGFSVNCNH